ncbi:MAG: diaminobutyrate acetyltransferase [Caulobacteraceae bacterium]
MEIVVDGCEHMRAGTIPKLRRPTLEDGAAVHRLVADCPPLDVNSRYCNLLQCEHFAGTCVVAETTDGLVGWISAYRPPSAPDEIFVWQVAVHGGSRGMGLGGRMLDHLAARPGASGAVRLVTTVTDSNRASMAMFATFARRRGLSLTRTLKFDEKRHFESLHPTEWALSIGPLPTIRQPEETQ